MESKIVRDFQNLRVIPNANRRMEGLVHDLSAALEDASKGSKMDTCSTSGTIRRNIRKRKERRRRSHLIENCNFSEASESSLDEALKDYIENVTQQSDSDDLCIARRIVQLTKPIRGSYVQSVESDSVNETFSPVRPQRRRKKHKSMAIDPDPNMPSPSIPILRPKYTKHKAKCHSFQSSSPVDGPKDLNDDMVVVGKRKRNTRSKTDYQPMENEAIAEEKGQGNETMDTLSSIESSSFSSSFSDTDANLTNDEAREGDDEQSDFFHEPGPVCGIPNIIPWWECDELHESVLGGSVTDQQFQQILNGSFEHLPKSSQMAFKARITKLMKMSGRQFHVGRRKLKGKIPNYTVSRFLQERQKWHSMQGKYSNWQSNNSNSSNGNSNNTGEVKRQRKTPPPVEELRDYVGGEADPIPETNIGNIMLQNMGWSPGSGLGQDGSGIKNPIIAKIRPKRQGLGCTSQYSSSPTSSKLLLQDMNT
ncbi:hypothetical protein ACJMK2_036844 [Sinanodonta woodiana]|uniref:G-patch domain-containing protein n=1 Tax=Sinanodonta woodiana TaxID=1069815 RepID=A0ABD3WMJ1_SINWO